tara:strand:- start:207 stop:533 length:327 start_codon:yes stop_codon:yes gene_type:complete
MYNVGDTIEYINHVDKITAGTISEINSSMNSYGKIIVKDDVVMYPSKKLTVKENKRRRKKGLSILKTSVYVPVKSKNMNSIYFTIPHRVSDDFVLLEDIIRKAKDVVR